MILELLGLLFIIFYIIKIKFKISFGYVNNYNKNMKHIVLWYVINKYSRRECIYLFTINL